MSKEIADRFRAMADLIEKNEGQSFGGAFVIAAPGTGEAKDGLVLSKDADPAQFWATIKVICDMSVAEMQSAHRQGVFRQG